MQSIQSVEIYIDEAPSERQEALRRIRHLCNSTLAGCEETMEDDKPTYKLNGKRIAGFASQAHHIAFYAYEPNIVEAHKAKLTSPQEGMVQFNKAEAVDYNLIEELLRDSAHVNR